MTMPEGLLQWGQAGDYDAVDDRMVITALAGGRLGLVRPPTMAPATGMNMNLGPWTALVAAGDGTTAVIGDRDPKVVPLVAGGAAARSETLWADVDADAADWHMHVLTAPELVGRSGLALGTIDTPVNANAASALTLRPAGPLPPLTPIVRMRDVERAINSQTTRLLDDVLQVPLEANSMYSFTLVLKYWGGAAGSAGHLSYGWQRPAGAVGWCNYWYLNTSLAQTFQCYDLGAEGQMTAGTNGIGSTLPVVCWGSVWTAGAGVFGLMWAQRTSTAVYTRIGPGSSLILIKR
jgi:hypothetical protein